MLEFSSFNAVWFWKSYSDVSVKYCFAVELICKLYVTLAQVSVQQTGSQHSDEGKMIETIVLIYYMPLSPSKVKFKFSVTSYKCFKHIHFSFSVGMFKVDPTERPTIHECIERLQEIAAARNVVLKSPISTGSTAPMGMQLFFM